METTEHVRVATYKITEGSYQDIAGSAKTGMLPTFKEQPGFVRYGLADVGDGVILSLSVWESREQADAAAPVAAAWVRDNLADRIELKSNYTGDVAFFEGTPATV
jgi:heme-degrading monooxygenase HmoA